MTPEEMKAIRKLMNMTQGTLASELDVSRQHINRMERGRKPISTVTSLAVGHLKFRRGFFNCLRKETLMTVSPEFVKEISAGQAKRMALAFAGEKR